MAVSLITSRRRQLQTAVDQVIAGSSWGFHLELRLLELLLLRGFKTDWPMSLMGQERPIWDGGAMSAFAPIATGSLRRIK
jgi:hypothetical protein